MIGRTLLHYKILDKLGEGGMGEVYLAEDTKLGRKVALKILPPECASEPRPLERFRREARALAALDHPNIVHIYSVELEDDLHFLTMQLIGGKLLAEELPARGMALGRFLEIAVPLTDALRAAHEKGIIHRDLKPTNVMLDDERRVKILDFGLAKLRLGDSEEEPSQLATEALTGEGSMLGTVPYMSPEQVAGEPVDHRTDVFSLGVILYEMATGRHPFAGANAATVASAILRDTPRAVTEVRAEVPERLGRLIGRCIAKDPRQRYQTTLDVYNELADIRDGVSGIGGGNAATSPVVAGRSPRSARKWLGIGALVLALGTFLYLGLERLPGGPDRPVAASAEARRSDIAILPFTVRGSPTFDYLGEGLVDLLSTKLDGAGELRAVDPHAVLGYVSERIDGVPTLAEARALAEHFGAGLHVVGEIVEAGGKLHVSAALYRAGAAQPVSQASVEGPPEELFRLIDQLAAELVTEQVSGPGAQFSRLAAVTTESLPALKIYLQAENELRSGQFTAAVETFQRTVVLDPEFALAWYRLSVAAEWAIRSDLVEAAAAEALRLSDRLSAHHQRLLEARVVSRLGRSIEAERLYRTILGTHPEDVEAWTQLAEVLSHYSYITGRSMSESRPAWERVLELEPNLTLALWHLVRIEAVEGRMDELRSIVDRLLDLTPEAERAHELRAIRAYVTGDVEEQRRVLEELEDVSDAVVTLIAWNLSLVTDDPAGAIEVAHEMARPNRSTRSRALGHVVLAYLSLSQGRWQEARRHLDDAQRVLPHLGLEHRAYLASLDFLPVADEELISIGRELLNWDATQVAASELQGFFFSATDLLHPSIRLYLLGLIDARLGRESALQYADSLESAAGSSRRPTIERNFARSIEAAWWRHHGDERRSLEKLRQLERAEISYQDAASAPFLSLGYERLLQGQLEMRAGEPENAMRWLSSLSEVSFYDDALVGLAHLYRGELAEGQGDQDAAGRHFGRFLELWPEPDPDLRLWTERAEAGLLRLAAP